VGKYKNSSLFAYSSEAKVTIGSRSGLEGIQESLTDFYDCGDPNIWSVTKGWNKKTLSGGDITVFNPCLNFLGCSTPAWLNESVGKSGIEGGFASRVLFVNQRERESHSVGWLDEEEIKDKDSIKLKAKLVEDLKQIHKLQGFFKIDKSWKEIYNQLQKVTNDKIDEGGEMRSYYSRKMWHLMKLAQVLSADMSNDMTLNGDHLLLANQALESIEPDMYSAFNMKGENKALASLTFVWEIMRKKKSWTRKELLASCFKHATSTQLDEHLRTFIAMDKVKVMPMTSGVLLYQVSDISPLGEIAKLG